MSSEFGVAPNVIARWERDQLPIPAWVELLVAEQAARQDEYLKLSKELWKASSKLAQLLDANQKLEVRNDQLEREVELLRTWQAAGLRLGEISGRSGKAEQIFRRLARKYHPDHHPQYAEFMADLNELFQAMKRR